MLKLIPHPSSPLASPHGLSEFSLEADARLAGPSDLEGSGDQRKLVLTYSAGGALNQILWPASLSSKPERKDELWKHTCFEAFIKPAGQDKYWEINLSPAGDWNVYRFTSYRQGMAREEAISSLSPVFTKDGDTWKMTCEVWIPAWAKASQLEIGLTSVMEETSGEISYWAIHHAGSQPDFHLAKSFSKLLSV